MMALRMAPDVVEVAVEPKTKADQKKVDVALTRLAAGDPSFRVTTDHESGQTIIKGAGELHLENLVERMKREFEVEANVGVPQVIYREILSKPAEVEYTHAKQSSGGFDQFGRVRIAVAPGEPESGVQFFDEIKGGNIPREYIPSIEKGMREAAESGSLGFPIVDFEIHLIDGAYHDIDSSPLAFEITGRGAMREAAQRAGIKLLEPIMKIEVVTPEDYLGDVIGVLNSRHGQLQSTDPRGNAQAVVATAPMAHLFGLEKELKRLTAGGAVVEIVWERYELLESSGIDPDDTFPAAAALRA